MRLKYLVLALLPSLWAGVTRADTPAFDLIGPPVDVRVARNGKTLPISQVPSLAKGDRLWIHPNLPDSQSTHYLLVVTFLRGATNPPPENWFTRIETWQKKVHEEGAFVVVPDGAEQVVLFLAPETGGDFKTLRSTVRGRPGQFVRAAQDLQQLSLDRARLDRYLEEIHSASETDPNSVHDSSTLLARSLNLKLDQNCFSKPVEQQATCLTRQTDSMVLDDTHSQTMVTQLTSGATADLANQISYSQMAGAGVYSAYVGAVVDIVRIMASVHNAQFQYIPALAVPQDDALNLRLNTAPSFKDPKSVIVVSLPPIETTPHFPPLRPVNSDQVACAQQPGLVLEADGAPLVFATEMAHDLNLVINGNHQQIKIPLKAAPSRGGLVLAGPPAPASSIPAGKFSAHIEGQWGFDPWKGPTFKLERAENQQWSLDTSDTSALIIGRNDTLHLRTASGQASTTCVQNLKLLAGGEQPVTLDWKSNKNGTLEVSVPLEQAKPEKLTLAIQQWGLAQPDTLSVRSYEEAAHLDQFTVSPGDRQALLSGTRLDTVDSVTLGAIKFTPIKLNRLGQKDQLTLNTTEDTSSIELNEQAAVNVRLKDDRQFTLPASIGSPRPQVTVVSHTQQSTSGMPSLQLASSDDIDEGQLLTLVLKSQVPTSFPRSQKIEIAAEDGSFATKLSVQDGTLVLEDAQTVLAVLDPHKSFGSSAFGPLRLRAVSDQGLAGDWVNLGKLVRVPPLRELKCPRSAQKPCQLQGDELFLISSISNTSDFTNAVDVPEGATGGMLNVPHPAQPQAPLYVKLRDDPDSVHTLTMPIVWTPSISALARPPAVPAETQSSDSTATVPSQP